ncbi:DUF2630 family protein [Tengunoibacter tsumagoiensis]|uniref:DUF2630 domain-containing protein n=1 Tax=Tengunoibacter tsumagoiensis TaxID=2014871 RepID=A0A402A5D9_9CHLR|nr:DUF2630 family protein [Tengunoibacter tsumagoiensis]GCE14357.1 hypothetical protein KTT_42160 [Tengunoibacter tsumagoiensis]
MNDQEILQRIQTLVNEEHHLLGLREEGKLVPDQHERVRELEISLDQCWDLLRQRRARRNAGEDPDKATVRDEKIVEHYQQ